MSRKRDSNREEILKQFDLPERQSKIATLLKQDGQEYCICRSSDSSRFMIGCDSCEEWYHGDCINITEKEAKQIKRFFCIRCREEDPTLVTCFKPLAGTSSSRPPGETAPSNPRGAGRKRKDKEQKSTKRCGQCKGCYQKEDCGRCEACKDMKKFGGPNKLKSKCKQRICINSNQYSKRRRKNSENDRDTMPPIDPALLSAEPRQCYGIRCTKVARFGSKYCSDECGLNLATSRIYQVLPPRLQEWLLSPCQAEERNKQQLDKIRAQLQKERKCLEELDKKHLKLDLIIENGKSLTIDEHADNENSLEDTDLSMYCITCGHEIHNRTAIKHMEKCFNKYESQASFGSVFKTRIEGNVLFCDYYNSLNKTYCKRLKVLCPEHCKDPKVSDNEVCGCPLVTNVFQQTGKFCRASKKKCMKHYAWEKLYRAEIDIERVRLWLKIDELLEQERQIRISMANRRGVVGLMLHSTYDHELMDKLTKASTQDKEAFQKELAKRMNQNKSEQNNFK